MTSPASWAAPAVPEGTGWVLDAGLNATAIGKWSVVERVSTGLLAERIRLQPIGRQMLAAADRLAQVSCRRRACGEPPIDRDSLSRSVAAAETRALKP